MSQVAALLNIVKKSLKARGLTYADVAKTLELSEASIKRMFNDGNISLSRLDQVCTLMDMDISDVVKILENEIKQTMDISIEHEEILCADPKLLVCAFLVTNGWKYNEILSHYRYTASELVQYLATLDKLKIIELFPRNRIKLLISSRFTWNKNGPIQQFFKTYLINDFLNDDFEQPLEMNEFLIAMLSDDSTKKIRENLEKIAIYFRDQNQQNVVQPIEKRKIVSVQLAMRSWKPSMFDSLRK
ncbi:MAG TPA: XRE family transcriptional regulator [Gammaproteobacteria bacterium]|nr:XRE family transcriptional regulator [Gammaproteobacteria bacterium]